MPNVSETVRYHAAAVPGLGSAPAQSTPPRAPQPAVHEIGTADEWPGCAGKPCSPTAAEISENGSSGAIEFAEKILVFLLKVHGTLSAQVAAW